MSYVEERLRNLRQGIPTTTSGQPTIIRAAQNSTYISPSPAVAGYAPPTYMPTMTMTSNAPPMMYGGQQSYNTAVNPPQDRLITDEYVLRDIHSKVHDHIDQKLKLETERRELELLIEAEMEKQKLMNSKFDEHKKRLKDDIYNLENKYADLEAKFESKNKMCKELDDKISDMRNECKKLDQDNRTIQSELKRLADKTNQQVGELQSKLKTNISTLEQEKEKFRRDAEGKKMENANQIKKLEDDYVRRLTDLSNKVVNAQSERDRYNKEVTFLKDKLGALEKEAEIKLREIENKIREEEKNKRSTALLALNQKLRSAEEKKTNQEKITSQLQRELEDLERKATDILGPLDKEAKTIKEDIEDSKRGIEVSTSQISQLKKQVADVDRECTMLAEARQRMKMDLTKAEDQHAAAIRDQNERFTQSKRNYENEIGRLRRNIEDKERDLKRHEDEYNSLNREYQRLMSNLQSNLTKTFTNTFSEYKPKY